MRMESKRRAFVLGVVVVAVACAAASAMAASGRVGGGVSAAGCTPAQGVKPTTILFGTSQPLTGPVASNGLQALGAENAFVQTVNAKGGIAGRKLRLISQDSAFNATKAVANMQYLIDRKHVFAIWGDVGSLPTAAEEPVATGKGVPLLFPNTTAKSITDPLNRLAFMAAANGYILAQTVGQYIAKHQPGAKAGMITINSADGVDASNGFKAGGENVVSVQTYDIGSPAFNSQIAALQQAGVTDLYSNVSDADWSKILQESDQLGFHPRMYGSIGTVSSTPFKLVNALVQGQHAVTPFTPIVSRTPGVKAYLRAMRLYSPGSPLGASGENAWTGGLLIAEALKRVGTKCLTTNAFVKALESIKNYDTGGISPNITLSSTNHAGATQAQIVVAKGNNWFLAP